MDVVVRAALRFGSPTARTRAYRALDRDARGYFDRSMCADAGDLRVTIDDAREIPADIDPWPWLAAFAESAADGALEYRTSLDPEIAIVAHRTPFYASRGAWRRDRYREGTPSGETFATWLQDARIALGLEPPRPPAPIGAFHVELVATGDRPLAVVKELRACFPELQLAQAKSMISDLPRVLEHHVPHARAHAWRQALEHAGATVRLEPA